MVCMSAKVHWCNFNGKKKLPLLCGPENKSTQFPGFEPTIHPVVATATFVSKNINQKLKLLI